MRTAEFRIVQVLDTQANIDSVIRVDIQHILNGTSLRVLGTFRYLIYFHPETATFLREEEHRVVHRGRIDVFHKVRIASARSLAAHAATGLCPELGQRRTLDISHVTDGDNHLVVSIKIFRIEFFARIYDFRTPFVAELLFNLNQFVLDYFHAKVFITQYLFEIFDLFQQFIVFVTQLLLHQVRQLTQTHLYDGFGLYLVQFETVHQTFDGGLRILGTANNMHDFVDVITRNNQTLQNMGTFFRLAQIILRPTDNHIVTMVHKVRDAILQRQQLGTPLHQRYAIHAEAGLQRSHLEQFVQYDICVGVAFHIHHDTHAFTVGFVIGIADAFNLLVVYQIGNLFNQLRFVYPVRNLRNDNLIVILSRLYLSTGTHNHTSAPRLVGIAYALHTVNKATGRKIRSLDILHQSVDVNIPIVYISHTSINDFP